MKKINTNIFLACCLMLTVVFTYAGNKDRSGQAGATELLINGWGRSSGFHSMNSAHVYGIEAMRVNLGGLALMDGKTEVMFASTQWLRGSGVRVNSAGFGQRVGESGVLGISMFSMGFGELPVTTVSAPEGNSGATFRPQLLNIGVAYARSFSQSIHVGFLVRVINQSIADVSASGVALDMGIQYVTGPSDNLRFGVALRNVGTPMRYRGDGLSAQLDEPGGQEYLLTIDNRSEKFELPSLLNIGIGYDIAIGEMNRVTLMGNFTSNSFSNDYVGGGIEYAFREMFMIRGGYRYEPGIVGQLAVTDRNNAHTGLAAGVSLNVPFKKDDEDSPALGIDYSYRTSSPYDGTHTLGVRIAL